ncbi:MAG: M56 family metallopeptidase [Clostridia bacterium]|nr:M56 family metallopeptidase [Clostridia bacterium]
MEAFILKIFEMSLSGGIMILAVLILRMLWKKSAALPRTALCFLWAAVGLRLVIPFFVSSPVGVVPSSLQSNTAKAISGIANTPSAQPPQTAVTQTPPSGNASIFTILTVLWALGVAALLIYCLVTAIRLKLHLAESVPYEKADEFGLKIRVSEYAPTPFIFGIVKPAVYLPFGMSDKTVHYVLQHETAHLKRGDHIWKVAAFLVLCCHWFNPLVWLAFKCFCSDTELACDERVFRSLSEDERCSYAEALVRCNAKKRIVSVCPVAFGESGIKERVKRALNYKKPVFIITAISVLCALLVCACCATQRPAPTPKDSLPSVSETERGEQKETEGESDIKQPAVETEKTEDTTAPSPTSDPSPENGTENKEDFKPAPDTTAPVPEKLPEAKPANQVSITSGSEIPLFSANTHVPADTSTAETATTAPEPEPEPEPWDCSASGHRYTEGVVVPWSCLESGIKSYTCIGCGDYYEELVRASGHDLYTIHNPPTCTYIGTYSYICSTCGYSVVTNTPYEPALGHDYVDGVCTRCGRS